MKTKEIIKKEYDIDNEFLHNEKANSKFLDKRKTIIISILICTMLLSIFVAPLVVNKLNVVEEAEKVLDCKKDTVVAVTATAATLSVAVAAIPGDSTTPLANQIAELDIFFIIVLISIYLLKVLLIVSTSLSFKILFPVTCLLFAIYFLSNNNYFKKLAIKILILGLVIFLTVPLSVGTMNIIDTSLKTQEKVEAITIEEKTENPVEKEKEDKNWWNNFWNDVTVKVKDTADTVTNATKEIYQKAKNKFSEMIDIVASLIITCCVIPLLVIVLLAWILKLLFGINIATKNVFSQLHNKMSKKFNKNSNDIDFEENLEI